MVRTAAGPDLERSLAREVARSLGAEPEVLPHLPGLLEDLSELGGSVRHVLEALTRLGLPPGSRALDLGCGKGVLAVRMAEQFDFDVTGVDAFAPFVEDARRRAAGSGTGDHCRFRCEDLRAALREPSEVDVALMIGLGTVFAVEDGVGAARRRVRAGGYIVIDGTFHEGTAHSETTVRLTARGDALLHEIVPAPHEVAQHRLLGVRSIRRKAELLTEKHPRLGALCRRYVDSCEKGALNADGSTYALWVLRRR